MWGKSAPGLVKYNASVAFNMMPVERGGSWRSGCYCPAWERVKEGAGKGESREKFSGEWRWCFMSSKTSVSGRDFRPDLQHLHRKPWSLAQMSPVREAMKQPPSALGCGWWKMPVLLGGEGLQHIISFRCFWSVKFLWGLRSSVGKDHAAAGGSDGQTGTFLASDHVGWLGPVQSVLCHGYQ